tara:strand:+ start:737 stop:862 length:126 start_codon:yes stop_codon:yes gene_type:complete
MSKISVKEKMLLDLLKTYNLEPELIFSAVLEGIAQAQIKEE